MSRADIVIVNWNAGPLLRAGLESLARWGGGRIASVTVVDNGSTDGSADVEVPGLPLEIVRAGRNLGFGAASNLGAARGAAPYLLFFNPDCALTAEAIGPALDFLEGEAARGVGICGIRLVGEDGQPQRHCARFPSWRSFVGHSFGLTGLFPRLFPPVLMEGFDHLSSRRVDHVIGAFYVIRRQLFEALGGFDRRFFVYLEDLDLSRRAAAAGWSCHYLAEAEAFHKGGGTSEQVKARRLFYALRSRLIYASIHFSRSAAFAVWTATLLVEPVTRLARALLRRSGEEMRNTLAGYRMLYRDLGATRRLIRSQAPRAE